MSPPKENAAVDLTASLLEVEASAKKLLASGLTKRAIVVLLAEDTGVARRDIVLVLESAANMSKWTSKGGKK